MKFRWTMKELEEFSDDRILISLIAERTSTLNPYAPLARRLGEVKIGVQKRIDEAKE